MSRKSSDESDRDWHEESSALASESGDSNDISYEIDDPAFAPSRVMRRRVPSEKTQLDRTPGNSSGRHSGTRKRRRWNGDSFVLRFCDQRCHPVCGRISTGILVASAVLWIIAPLFQPDHVIIGQNLPVRERVHLRTEEQRAFSTGAEKQSFANSVVEGFRDLVDVAGHGRRRSISREANKEDVPDGCERPEWQDASFPNCNDVHGIDLSDTLIRSADAFRNSVVQSQKTEWANLGYLAKGYWRSVWAVSPSDADRRIPAVLKMMLRKHDTDSRNFDRHRRDALVMERLTASPHVVDIYGFCGNSVLTEYIATPLDAILHLDWEEKDDGTITIYKERKEKELNPRKGSRETARGRLNLALGAAKGLEALHQNLELPIVHADIQARQFLVTDDGVVKINDFNRCRFMARHVASGKPCKISIPSAPGKARSPEEYKKNRLDERLDVYSLANVYYGILTGRPPWGDYSTREVQKMVKRGIKPVIPPIFRKHRTTDEALATLTMDAFENEPMNRPSSHELVQKLEELIEQLENTE